MKERLTPAQNRAVAFEQAATSHSAQEKLHEERRQAKAAELKRLADAAASGAPMSKSAQKRLKRLEHSDERREKVIGHDGRPRTGGTHLPKGAGEKELR